MSESTELRSILADQVNRLLGDRVTKAALESAEAGSWPAELWQAIEENGLTRVLVPEEQGGVGGSWAEAEVVLRAAGRYQAPVPLAEGVLAGWLLSGAGLEMPEGPISVAPVRREETLSLRRDGDGFRLDGSATRIPWGRGVDHLAVLAMLDGAPWVALIAKSNWRAEPDANIAAEPRDSLRFDGAAVIAAAPAAEGVGADGLYRMGALARSAQIAGALACLLEQSVQYANDRVQFGRAIGKFQAVQQELARLAGEVAASGAATEAACRAACRTSDGGDAAPRSEPGASFEIAVAKTRCSEAASTGAAIAHQAHGAIGFTYEHSLHFATRRLWSWRAEFGSESHWAEEIGRAVAGRGAEALWPFITERRSAG